MNHSELYKENVAKGKVGEDKFQNWLDERDVPFIRVDSSRGTMSKALREKLHSKRPDFILFIKNIGSVFVDVKNRQIKDGCFEIENQDDLEKLAMLEESTPVKMYIVVPNREDDMRTWYWFHAKTLYEKHGKNNTSKRLKIPFEEHFTTSSNSNFSDIIKNIALI